MSAIAKQNILKNNNYKKKKSLRPRCAIDQNAFRFPGARPNKADAWIRNCYWEDDNDLKKRLSLLCQSEFKENGNIRLREKRLPHVRLEPSAFTSRETARLQSHA